MKRSDQKEKEIKIIKRENIGNQNKSQKKERNSKEKERKGKLMERKGKKKLN